MRAAGGGEQQRIRLRRDDADEGMGQWSLGFACRPQQLPRYRILPHRFNIRVNGFVGWEAVFEPALGNNGEQLK